MATAKFIKINNYDILDQDGAVIESGLTMDQEATVEDGGEEIHFIVEGGPLIRPKSPR